MNIARAGTGAKSYVSDVDKDRSSSFEDVVKPVIKWLNENANPHTSVVIDATSAHLLTGEIGIHTEEFIKD
jgi:predicted double-glycine peptidase